MTYPEFSLHHMLRLQARTSHIPGVIFTSAPTVARLTDHSEKTAQRLLVSLSQSVSTTGIDRGAPYIKRFWRRGWRGDYAVLINKFTVWDGSQELRVDAHATRDWREPMLVPVHDLSSDLGSHLGSELGSPKRTNHYGLSPTTTNGPVENRLDEMRCEVCEIDFPTASERDAHYLSVEHGQRRAEVFDAVPEPVKAEAS